MIVARRKPFAEIEAMLKEHKQVLTVGCGTCVAVCLVGGEKEVRLLNAELDLARRLENRPIELGARTLERQCDREYLEELTDSMGAFDALLSMACGVGIQCLAERFPSVPVYPAVDTTGAAANLGVGWYEERCRSCGHCVLAQTAGICPVTMCAKGLYNGPCGGTNAGQCEIGDDHPCAWHRIYERLAQQGRLATIQTVWPAVAWEDQFPRRLVQPGYEKGFADHKP